MTHIETMRKMIAEDLHYFSRDLDDYFSDLCHNEGVEHDSDEYQKAVAKGKEILAALEEKVRTWEI